MSFILDALKKIEREKETVEPGVVMVGPVPWGGQDRGHRRRALAGGAGALVMIAAVAFWWLGSGGGRSPASPESGQPPRVAAPASRETPVPADARFDPAPPPPPPRTLEVPGTPERPPAAASEETSALEAEALTLEEALVMAEETTSETTAPQYRLTAISSRDGQPIALLNDRLVREGDSFGGITVIQIGPASVEIEVNGERKTIGF